MWECLRRYKERRNHKPSYVRGEGPRKPSGATALADSGMAAGHHHPRQRALAGRRRRAAGTHLSMSSRICSMLNFTMVATVWVGLA
jgi:hypothetical protein